ncbi:MAG: hypothetical protein GXO71_05595 [Caldiserica bacterium]|nr:hypothetical protein [Caldisericota bacterium]
MGRKAQELLMERFRGFNDKTRKILLPRVNKNLKRAIGLDAEEIKI